MSKKDKPPMPIPKEIDLTQTLKDNHYHLTEIMHRTKANKEKSKLSINDFPKVARDSVNEILANGAKRKKNNGRPT